MFGRTLSEHDGGRNTNDLLRPALSIVSKRSQGFQSGLQSFVEIHAGKRISLFNRRVRMRRRDEV